MGVQITFNYGNFIQLFPQLAYVAAPQAGMIFGLATQFHRNDGVGPITDQTTQTNLLYLVMAHIIQLMVPPPPGQGGGRDASAVGRIASASEGSVSVSFEMPQNPNAAWWNQTQFGAMYWQASVPFRTMRYVPGAPKPVNPWPIFGNRWW